MKRLEETMPRLVAEPHTLPLPLGEGRGEGCGIAGLEEGRGEGSKNRGVVYGG